VYIVILISFFPVAKTLNQEPIEQVYLPRPTNKEISYGAYDGTTNVPLLLNFHVFGMQTEDQMYIADFRELADVENFVLIYPQGLEIDGESYNSHWNPNFAEEDNKSSSDAFGDLWKAWWMLKIQLDTGCRTTIHT
jgi:hypothetical protein